MPQERIRGIITDANRGLDGIDSIRLLSMEAPDWLKTTRSSERIRLWKKNEPNLFSPRPHLCPSPFMTFRHLHVSMAAFMQRQSELFG